MTYSIELQEGVELAPLTTLKIGGPARYFFAARSERDVADAVNFAQSERLEIFVLGGGSNVLISDRGFDGLVLQIGLKGIRSDGEALTASAGEDWDGFVAHCVHNDLAGVECLSGIPGSVGGTPVQNVGAYGQDVSDTIVSVRCFDRLTKQVVRLANAECGFAYRTSIFNSVERDRHIVLSVSFLLQKGGQPHIAYKDLKEHFGDKRPSLMEVREAVLKIRRSKSMVIDRNDPNSKSAGSFFKNPVIEKSKLEEIEVLHENVPFFEFGDKVKIPAAWLIEKAGFSKGFTLGNAGISSNHTLALINRGEATSEEMLALKATIQREVERQFDILLQPEPLFVGF